jgi:hypothetical protein
MRGESILDFNVFGQDPDIDFSESPSFSKNFFVTGPDRKAVEKFFRPEIVDAFAENPMKDIIRFTFSLWPSRWIVEGEGSYLILYCLETRVPSQHVEQFAGYARQVLLPFVKKAAKPR